MKKPMLKASSEVQTVISSFSGYDHRERIREGAFYDCKNLSFDRYPILSCRRTRGAVLEKSGITGLLGKDALCYTQGSRFFCGSTETDLGLTAGEKTLLSMGAYVLIFPDKKYVNTADLTDSGNLSVHNEIPSDGGEYVSVANCDAEGADINVYVGASAPTITPVYWLDSSSQPYQLKKWDSNLSFWNVLSESYVSLTFSNTVEGVRLTEGLSEGDYITLPGILIPELADYETSPVKIVKILHQSNYDRLVIRGVLVGAGGSNPVFYKKGFSVERSIPDMDFCVEAGNRLWGCKYGTVNGKPVNEIYASALGDFKNWKIFCGVATDSYAVSVGTDGPFTGAVNYEGRPLFFKEGYLHRISGFYPAEYQVQSIPCDGIQAGSHKSAAITDGVLYYKSPNGICRYAGNLPETVSDALGELRYTDAVGGALGHEYCVDMKDSSDVRHLFRYNAARKLWQKEDSPTPLGFTVFHGMLYYAAAAGIYSVLPEARLTPSGNVAWYGESGLLGLESPEEKYIRKLVFRLAPADGCVFRVLLEYDSSGKWVQEACLSGSSLTSVSLPVLLRRCDHFRLRLEGTGDFKLFSVTRVTGNGGKV